MLSGGVGNTGAGFALGADFACQQERPLGKRRTYQLADQNGEQHYISHKSAIGKGCGG